VRACTGDARSVIVVLSHIWSNRSKSLILSLVSSHLALHFCVSQSVAETKEVGMCRKGKMCSLFINDLDAGAGRMGLGTQYTVNNQMVNATLMNIADNPTNVQLPGVYKNVSYFIPTNLSLLFGHCGLAAMFLECPLFWGQMCSRCAIACHCCGSRCGLRVFL
jgi:hypothetical protein